MKFWDNWKNQNWFPYTVAICVGVCLYMFLSNITVFAGALNWVWAIAKPLFYGLILAYLMDPVARFYEAKIFAKVKNDKIKRNISVVLGVITVLAIVALLIVGVAPALIQSISSMFNNVSDALEQLDANSGSISSVLLPGRLSTMLAGVSISSTIISSLSEFVTSNLGNIANTSAIIGNGFANLVIAFILALYYMMDKSRLEEMSKRFFLWMLKEKKFARFEEVYQRADVILLKYIQCNIIEGFIVGACNAVFMLIGRLPYVLLISIVVGVTNLAPTFGPLVGAVIGGLLLLLINPWYALAFLIFTVVIQTVDGYIIKPKLFGETLGVSPLLILIMIILGGRIMGVVGILIAIPVAAIAQYLWDDMWKRKKTSTDLTK